MTRYLLHPSTGTAVLLAGTVAISFVFPTLSSQAAAPTPAADRCAALASMHRNQVEIESAQALPAGAAVAGTALPDTMGQNTGPPISGLPAFCRVIGHIHPEPGSDIRFETWMPSEGWDGRLHGAGNGGLAGSISYMELAAAVRVGQAAVSTNTGHDASATDSAWANGHPERIHDYGWRGLHLSTVAAKQLVAKYYGRSPDHSYFMSCSNGGREALMEASRFPEDYDGIMAGAPAAVISQLITSMTWTVQAQMPPGAALRPEQAHLLQSEVVKQCDAFDGQSDGLIADPRRCKVDVSKLACGTANSPECFVSAQLEALRKIYAGPHNSSGQEVAPGYPASGAEAGSPSPTLGWEGWIMAGGQMPPLHRIFSTGLLKDLVAKPFADVTSFDFDKDPARLKAAIGADLDAQPRMRPFFDRGGKLIIWHGWADAAIPPQSTLEFHQAVLRTSGPRAKDSMRLFMIPGLEHCFGGTGPTIFGQLSTPSGSDRPESSLGAALQAWTETGRTPDSVVGRKGAATDAMGGRPSPGETSERLLCAWPAQAVLRSGAAPEQASSYECR
jgi:feruloyl esterase